MLEKIREGSQGMIAKVILGFVILTFALAGVGSYLGNTKEPVVAVVNGEDITKAEFDTALQNERNRMQQQFGDMFSSLASDTNYMNSFRSQVLEKLIDEKLQKQLMTDLNLMVSDQQVRETILAMTEFQVDGVFNNDRYLALLRQNGYEPNQFRDYLRGQMSRNQLVSSLVSSEFATESELTLLAQLQQQTRDVQYLQVKAASFADKVEVTEQMLQDYYQTNLNQFVSPETVAVDYVQLNKADIAAGIEVSDADLQAYYDANLNRYKTDERRRVSHILLESAEDNAEIKTKAEALAAQLAQGADFAELAKKESSDTFSAENGGDLDFIEAGVMDPEFEKAAFALKQVGDVSPVVKTEFGYHLIKLTAIEASQTKDFADVKTQIATELKDQKAAEKFIELQQALGEKSFEIADSLQEAAEAIGGKVVSVPAFTQGSAPAPLNAPAVVSTLFSEEFIAGGVNSDVLEVSADQVLVARISAHQPEKTKGFDEVKEQVRTAVVSQKTEEMAQAQAAELLAALQAGGSMDAVAQQHQLTVESKTAVPRFGGDLDADIRTKAFELAKPSEQAAVSYGSLTTAAGDSVVLAVTKVTNVEVTATPSKEDLEQFGQQKAQQSYAAVIAALKAKAQIVRSLEVASSDEQ
ncbi:SurA N-terminal domain-containing protein [Rheinheimera sp.]|uniref:SurA N-terminal domain-containing protein n=1 Tax=Rheinheimera sp. TaxID=1869214 RepID=UPI003AF9927C